MAFDRIAVLGAGSWGTALAIAAARAGRDVVIWARQEATAQAITTRHESPMLPGIPIDERIVATTSLAKAAEADVLLLAVPAQSTRNVAIELSDWMKSEKPVVSCAKGIERGTAKFMTEVIAESTPHAIPAILSGPSFARDVGRGMPTAVTLAAPDEQLAAELARALGSPTFRPYHSTDLRGVEIGGAAKNVLAIAAGVVMGRGLGESATAALTTRGFAELVRFGQACGARLETLMGLSGLGDLILTCSSPQSRNFTFGVNLGRDHEADAIHGTTGLAEGVFTASVLVKMATERGIEMPIASAVADIVGGRVDIDDAIETLLARPIRAEGI